MSNSLKSIESDAFDGCASLQSIDLPESLNYLGPAFASCGLKTVTIPNGITELLPLTFANCPYLESVTIPNTMKTIGYAFEGCSSFSIVNVLDIATWCGMTFMGDFRPTRDGMHLYLNGTEVFDLVIPSSVEVINQEVFSEFNWIKTVDISDFVTTIGEQAFYNCTGLESVKFGTGLQSIGDNAFGYCENLKSVSLPTALKDLGEYTFTYCTSLESIELPDAVEVIPEAFMRGCESLTTLTIPSNVTKIEQSAFSRTENLTTVYFPAKLKSVGSLSFEESAIKDAYCEALVPPTCATGSYATFSDTRLGNSTLHVPLGTKEAYAKADQWKLFGNIVEGSDANGIESLESDAEKCFDIIDLKGRILKHNATIEDLNSLDSDIYIINGEKKFIKR